MSVTRRQKEVLDFISNFVQRNGYSPSFEEIARGLSLKSLATVHKHITNLQKKGLLQRAHNRSRSIDVLPPRSKTRRSGSASAVGADRCRATGRRSRRPAKAISLGDVIGNREVFALQVRGDSMRDEHIVDGDYVLVEHTSTARQGEIIVALVRGSETTLKRYYIEGDQVRLQPVECGDGTDLRAASANCDTGTGAGGAARVPVPESIKRAPANLPGPGLSRLSANQ